MRLLVKVRVCHICHEVLGVEDGSEGVESAHGLEMMAHDTCMKVKVPHGCQTENKCKCKYNNKRGVATTPNAVRKSEACRAVT